MPLYLITNTVNEKQYVGQTQTKVKYRWSKHKWEAKQGTKHPLYDSIRKYGEAAFSVEEISPCLDRNSLNNLEKVWIILLQTTDRNKGYNLTNGGERNFTVTDEVKEKLRLRSSECWKTPGFREKMRATLKGRKVWNTGKKQPPEYGQRVSEGLKNYWATQSPEVRKQKVGGLAKSRWGG